MKLIQLTQENADHLGFNCMLKGNLMVRNPGSWRNENLPEFKKHLGQDVWGFVAVEENQPVGHILLGTLDGLGAPVRCSNQDVLVIQCVYLECRKRKKGIGRALVNAAREAFTDRPGLLVLSTKVRMYMHYKAFERMGFQIIYSEDMWRIGYLPIQQDHVSVEWFTPELEWDYVKPFTMITGGYCPFLLYTWDKQKKIASRFRQYAPIDEMTWETARSRDPRTLPGLYLFGKMIPAKPMFGWQLKHLIKRTIRQEEKKTFGAAAPTGYIKQKKN